MYGSLLRLSARTLQASRPLRNGTRRFSTVVVGEPCLSQARSMVAKIGKPAPKWSGTAVIDEDLQKLSLDDYKGKYLVFFFYPADFTFVCPTEIWAFSDRIDEFRSIGAEVVGCSVDSAFSHLNWIQQPRKLGGLGAVTYPLLSDITKSISADYDVLIEDGDDAGIALRGLFVISPQGVLRQKTVNDLPVGRSVDETLRLVKAFQFTDEHGEVCPANWAPGGKAIDPDPKKSKDFFSKVAEMVPTSNKE